MTTFQVYEVLCRAHHVAFPLCEEAVQDKMLAWLYSIGEEEAGDWYKQWFSGKKWMLTSQGYATVDCNNGQEASNRYHHAAMGGGQHNVSLPFFLTNHVKYMTDFTKCIEAKPPPPRRRSEEYSTIRSRASRLQPAYCGIVSRRAIHAQLCFAGFPRMEQYPRISRQSSQLSMSSVIMHTS